MFVIFQRLVKVRWEFKYRNNISPLTNSLILYQNYLNRFLVKFYPLYSLPEKRPLSTFFLNTKFTFHIRNGQTSLLAFV